MVLAERRPGHVMGGVERNNVVAIILPEDERTPLEILRTGENAKQENIAIPLGEVTVDYSLVDDSHAEELKDSMGDKWGQTSSIIVRTREDNGSVVYDIIDGFHRTEGRKRMGAQTIKANVLYGVSDEEMFDLRIVATNSVRSVQFPRIAEWISRSYSQTKWSKKEISVTQAFTLALTDRETSYKVAQKDLEDIKEWVRNKCRRWQRSPGYIYDILKTVEAADPELVKRVRIASGGRDREQKVTPSRLKQVATGFPGRENYRIQNMLMDASINSRFYAPQTAILVDMFKQKLKLGMSEKEIEDTIAEAVSEIKAQEALQTNSELDSEIGEQAADEFRNLRMSKAHSDGTASKAITIETLRETFTAFGRSHPDMTADEASEVTRRTLRLIDIRMNPDKDMIEQLLEFALDDVRAGLGFSTSVEKNDAFLTDGITSSNPGSPKNESDKTQKPDTKYGIDPSVLDTRGDTSENQMVSIEMPHSDPDDSGHIPGNSSKDSEQQDNDGGHMRGWWETASYLNQAEHTIMFLLFSEGLDAEQVARKAGIYVSSVGHYVQNVLTKQILFRRNNPKLFSNKTEDEIES